MTGAIVGDWAWLGVGGLVARLWVGRPVGVLPLCDVIAVACSPLAHGHPTSTCDAGVNV